MWIKICGNTNLEDARYAVEAGADALGFVFAPSPRQVGVDQVRQIISKLPAEVKKYGVFVDAGFDEIVETVSNTGLTGVQIHRSADPLLPSRLRHHFAHIDIVLAVHYQPGFEQQLSELSRTQGQTQGIIDAILVDSSSAKAVGGTGTRFDWSAAHESFASPLRLIAAGGLAPDNVTDAIALLRPWGVDVVTGVESKPGKKDPQRVLQFIQAAQQAANQSVYQLER